MRSKLLVVAAAACATLATTACTTSAAPAAPSSRPVTSSPTEVATTTPLVAPPIPAEAWKVIRDEASGFAVSLPEFVSPDKSVDDPPQRVYTVKLSHEAVAELTVAFIDTVVAPKRLEAVVKAKEGTLKSQGATEVVISDVAPALHAGKFAAYDFKTSYTLKGVKTVIWSRYIAGPKSFVVVATEVTGDATAAEPVARMREYHQRTVDSVVAI